MHALLVSGGQVTKPGRAVDQQVRAQCHVLDHAVSLERGKVRLRRLTVLDEGTETTVMTKWTRGWDFQRDSFSLLLDTWVLLSSFC